MDEILNKAQEIVDDLKKMSKSEAVTVLKIAQELIEVEKLQEFSL